MTDTGFFCRHILGMNKDGDSGEPWKGGVRDHGPHQELVQMLDDPDVRLGIVLMPRNSYKSSIIMGRILREILSNPNCTVLLCMHDYKKAMERTQTMRDILLENPVITRLYGNLRGKPWRQNAFVTTLRTNRALLEPTFSCCARDALPTGGHYSLIIMDDIIDDQASKTEEGIASSKRALSYLMPLRTTDGKMMDVGTLYADGDVHHAILEQKNWKRVIHEVGYELVQNPQSGISLEGEETYFTMLSKEFLNEQLGIMGPRIWLSQYKNRLVGVGNQIFDRRQFQPIAWSERLRGLTGYLLTDTASSEKQEGCYSVIAYAGLDERYHLYILDLEIGHWSQQDFIDRFFRMREKWATKVNHQGECMESATLSLTYIPAMEAIARKKRLFLNFITLPRHARNEHNKDQRILRLQPRFQSRQVWICDTVPREFTDFSEQKVLWDPEGYEEPQTGQRYPGGELVRQFCNFRLWSRSIRDIPDAIAQIDELDPKTRERFCFYKRPPGEKLPESVARRRVVPGRSALPSRRFHGIYRRRR